MKRLWFSLVILLSVLETGVLVSADNQTPVKPESNTRLVVVCVFDQLRGDYPTRWKNAYGTRGFRKVMAEGTHFTNCHYPYGITVTGPGHASIATGAPPKDHGIIANEWYDSAKGQTIYCSANERYKNVPQKMGVTPKRTGGGSPDLLKVPTIGDTIKEATQGKGKVFSLSSKDRGAVLLAGKKADGCYWWDTDTGKLGTSTFFRDAVQPWVNSWNSEGFAEKWAGQSWERFRTDLDYNQLAGPDQVLGEKEGTKPGTNSVFPHLFPAKTDKAYYNALYASPFANEILLDLAFRAIEAEQLGKDETPDLLLLSFSSNDVVGHGWGPDSQEVLDITLRTDDLLARLFHDLDLKVGPGKWTVYISSDHGVCPLPELSKAEGKDAGRIDVTKLKLNAEKFLHEKFQEPNAGTPFLVGELSEHLYLNRPYLKSRNLDIDQVANALSQWLLTQEGINKAYTRNQILESGTDDPLIKLYKEGFDPQRSGEIILVQKPYWLFGKGTGTSHGTPYPYDTHVPLMILGNGAKKLISDERVTPLHIAPMIARELGIPKPAGCTIQVPALTKPVSFEGR